MMCFGKKRKNHFFSLFFLINIFSFFYGQSINPAYAVFVPQNITPQQNATSSSQPIYKTSSSVTTIIGNPPANSTENPTPTTNTCKGMNGNTKGYDLTLSGENFGDPICDFTKNRLAVIITQQDPNNKYLWYSVIVPGESSYNPNAVEQNDPIDPAKARGLFQMGKGLNGQYDHGDVYWKLQFSNAYNYNVNLDKHSGDCHGMTCSHLTWCYWATAQASWCYPLGGTGNMK